nr:immunoglobulin light chain junction region [Macaca mulatta]
CLQFKIYPYSF